MKKKDENVDVGVVTSFRTIIDSVKTRKKKTVVVAAAAEHDILAATIHARQEGLADFLYVGDSKRIQQLAAKYQLDISDKV